MPGRRLYRSRVDRKVAGVCGGIAEYFDIDPVFVRIAAFLLMFPHGLGVIAYLVCWIAIPQRPEGAEAGAPGDASTAGDTSKAGPAAGSFSPADRSAPPPPAAHGAGELIAGGALIAVGLFFLLINLGILDWTMFHFWRWRLVWPMLVIALGIYVVLTSLRAHLRGPGKEGS
jgi:phage shock protein PspC (stress-responsive transcriptional regulator)